MAETHTSDAVNIAGSGRNPVGWFEIYMADMQRAKDFYGDMEMWFFAGDPMAAGASGGLIRHDMRQPGMEGTLVYFSVDDCAAAIARAAARGSTVLVDRLSIGEMGFIGIVTDNEGNSIGLHSMM